MWPLKHKCHSNHLLSALPIWSSRRVLATPPTIGLTNRAHWDNSLEIFQVDPSCSAFLKKALSHHLKLGLVQSHCVFQNPEEASSEPLPVEKYGNCLNTWTVTAVFCFTPFSDSEVTLRLWESSESWRTAVHRIPNRIIRYSFSRHPHAKSLNNWLLLTVPMTLISWYIWYCLCGPPASSPPAPRREPWNLRRFWSLGL